MLTPVRPQAAWATVTGTFRTATWAPGCPQAALNSGGTALPAGADAFPHAATLIAMSAEKMAIAAGVADRLKIQFTKIRRYPMPPRSGIG